MPERPLPRIASRRHAVVARYRAATRGASPNLVLLDGPHLVGDALAAGVPIEHAAVVSDARGRADIDRIVAELTARHVETVVTTAQVMSALSPVRSSSAVVALARRPAADFTRIFEAPAPLVVVASDVQDPGNLGAIVRVAEAGGATGVVTTWVSADPFGWKALRGSMGSALRLPVARASDAGRVIADARAHDCRVIATVARGGRSMFDVDLTRPTVIFIGGEGSGLTPALVESADERVTIPMRDEVESLNAAVAAALIVYEAWRQRRPQRDTRAGTARRHG